MLTYNVDIRTDVCILAVMEMKESNSPGHVVSSKLIRRLEMAI